MSISLLIPTYNVEDYLPALIESAYNQTVPFAEIVVYDDASSDSTADVAESLNVRVIRGDTNRGPAYARNCLLRAAKSDFVHLHDSDDTHIPERFVEVMERQADTETAAICRWKMVGKDQSERVFAYDEVDDWTKFFINHYVHLNAAVYPRAFLVEHGGFDDDMIQCDELLMTAKMASFGLDFAYTDAITALHERREGSLIDDLEPAEPHKWAVRMCERLLDHLDPAYHENVGKKALYHTVGLAKADATNGWIQRGVQVIERAGLSTISSHGRLTHWISQLVGNDYAIRYIAYNA